MMKAIKNFMNKPITYGAYFKYCTVCASISLALCGWAYYQVFDTEDQPVDEDDIPKIIGNEALNRMGEFALSAVHVRNHNYHKDYEILRVRENWPGNHDDEEDE